MKKSGVKKKRESGKQLAPGVICRCGESPAVFCPYHGVKRAASHSPSYFGEEVDPLRPTSVDSTSDH